MVRHHSRVRVLYIVICGCSGFAMERETGAQTIELRPVNNGLSRPVDAPAIAGAVIVGNQISLTQGGVNIELEILASGWGNFVGGSPLFSAVARVNSNGYLGVNASPAHPGVDLTPLGWPSSPSQGAFQVTQLCSGSGRDCGNGQPGCNAGTEGVCITSSRFLLSCCDVTSSVDTTTLDFRFSTAVSSGGESDPGPGFNPAQFGYFGTLVLQVPTSTVSTYTIGFVDDPDQTKLCPADCANIAAPQRIPAVVRVANGSCCRFLFGLDWICTDDVTMEQCEALPSVGNPLFRSGKSCLAAGCINCEQQNHCGDNVSGTSIQDNRCTSNQCLLSNFQCLYTPTFDSQTMCCDPATGITSNLADSSTCTTDVCNVMNGQVSHIPNNGMPCDDFDPCTVQDSCNGTLCRGTPVSAISCASDADCSGQYCNLNNGSCVCADTCPSDPAKTEPGICGCGVPDEGDSDADSVLDCVDLCPGLDDHIFAPDCEPPIPTVSQWGFAITTLLLLVCGKHFFGARRFTT